MEFTPRSTPDEETRAADTAPPALDTQASTAETLSPAVRRLIRQYDLDITTIQGTGPSGRIRVGDVIGMLGGRAAEAPPMKPVDRPHAEFNADETLAEDAADEEPEKQVVRGDEPAAAPAPAAVPTTTIFDCDLSRVLAHRKRLRAQNVDVLITSYFLVALADASRTVAEIAGGAAPVFDVRLTAADGNVHALHAAADESSATTDAQLRNVDAALRASANGAPAAANVLVHHYGASGSLLAAPTPIGPNHAGSIGIGRVRREIVVRANDAGEESPRVTALCNFSLSFRPDRIAFDRANLLMATAVRFLESWPD